MTCLQGKCSNRRTEKEEKYNVSAVLVLNHPPLIQTRGGGGGGDKRRRRMLVLKTPLASFPFAT